MLLMMLIYDRITERRAWHKLTNKTQNTEKTDDEDAKSSDEAAHQTPATDVPEPAGIGRSLLDSADATANASGGLLSLMALSVCLGGIIDRSNLSKLLPEKFSSYWIAMLVMVIILVILGMIMDPYGAVILVSATMTQIAAANQISPIHFWLVVLCAFELGYLTPPVALNQLLTRQVVGEDGYAYEDSPDRPKKFWYRHERILLPIAIKGTVLLLVAFIPLLIRSMHWMGK